MQKDNVYDILIQIFSLNIDFNIIFQEVEQPYKDEILKFVDFIKKHPIKGQTLKENLMKYNVSDKSKKIILEYINYILKKIDK